MLRHLYVQMQAGFPRYAVPEAIPQGKYTILMTELRETPDTAPAGWLWVVTDRALLMEYAAGTIADPTPAGYQTALNIAAKVISTIARRDGR